jgi:hypothetical protein
MNKQAIEKLRNDELYYGDYGKKFLSNSDISTLFNNPLALGQPSTETSAFLVGKYFHTAILEPDKLKSFKVIKSTTRNTKVYKEMSHQIGIFDCSDEFLQRGDLKVEKASGIYDLFFKTKDFDPKQYFITKTL